jgi:hypothetical protein
MMLLATVFGNSPNRCLSTLQASPALGDHGISSSVLDDHGGHAAFGVEGVGGCLHDSGGGDIRGSWGSEIFTVGQLL